MKGMMKKEKKMMKEPIPMMDEEDFQGKDDFMTLHRAEMIKRDPKRMERAHKHAKGFKRSIKSIEDLKSVIKEKEHEMEEMD